MICTKCNKDKPTNEFQQRDSWKGVASWCKECVHQDVLERQTRCKILVLAHYGGWPPKCACCGESEIRFLTIDHVENIGKDRKRGGKLLAQDLVRLKFPPGFQILCYNCNLAKGIYGVSPHKDKT